VQIEILVFQLKGGVDEEAFLAADKRVQGELSPAAGFVRRTTARGDNGNWLVLTFWHLDKELPDQQALLADVIDPATARAAHFTSLPG
jgi:hypothetical protein